MHCVRCGKEIKEDVVFCPYCGAKQSREQEASKQMDSGQKSGEGAVETAGQAAAGTGGTASDGKPAGEKPSGEKTSGEKPSNRKVPVAAIAAGVVVLLAAVGLGAFFLTGKSGKEEEDIVASAGGVSEAVQEDTVETPLYSNVQPGVIDLYAENVNPGEKVAGMGWDDTLFYWLEDCDTTSDADGNIARCRITKTQMFAADNGELIQYEIYHNPDTDSVCKIVSIRKSGDSLTLTDYYYQEGRPDFIFERSDSVYTPTYATIDKVGERYYFNSDVMVRWRIIREPQQIGEYTLNPSEVWYSQADYFAESNEIRGIYDAKEREMLNRAYNTWNAVAADSGIGTVEGYVRDTAGTPVSGAVVNIYRRTDGVLLYQLETGEDGRFQAYVYLNGEECFFTVTGDESVYKAAVVNGLNLTDNSLIHSYDNLVLHKVSGDEYQVHLDVRAANEAKVDEDGVVSCEKLRGVTVNFREGSDSREGEILLTAQAAENGEIIAKLPSGTYTAELVTDGYITTWVNVEVPEQETWCSGWMIPATAEDQTAVVLTWEGEDTDLDLTVFTPKQSTAGDMAHVGGSIAADEWGNLLISDNPSGCEVIYLNTAEVGAYKIYVSDYTDSVGGNYSADRLSAMNVHIYIYNSEGLVGEYTFPAGQNGVVWEVAEVNGRTVTPSQRTYTEISGKNWWTADKNGQSLQEALENDLGRYMQELVVREAPSTVTDGINRICQGDILALRSYFLSDNMAFYPEDILYEVEDGYCLSEDNYNKMIYSMTGNSTLKRFDVSDETVRVYDGVDYYLVYGWAGYTGPVMKLENPRIAATGAGTWDVTFDAVYHDYFWLENEKILTFKAADITFHVVADSGSIFDGYRVTGAESVYSALTQEVFDAYREKIYEFCEYATSCNLYDINGDMIPELYLDSGFAAGGGILFTYVNGGLQELYIERGEGSFAWQGANFIRNDCGNMGSYSAYWSIITENGFEPVFSGSEIVKIEYFNNPEWTGDCFDYWIGEEPCTTEEYYAAQEKVLREHLGEEYQKEESSYRDYYWESFGGVFTVDEMLFYLQDGWKQD